MTSLPTLTGNQLCFVGTGGFVLAENFAKIKAADSGGLQTFDVTQAVQVLMDVRYFNSLIGLEKGLDNISIPDNTAGIIYSSYSDAADTFMVKPTSKVISSSAPYNWETDVKLDGVKITPSDLRDNLKYEKQIDSTGAFAGVYSRFKSDVLKYFGWSGGFASLFAGSSDFDINSGVDTTTGFLTKNGMRDLLTTTTATTTVTENYISPITGDLTLATVIKMLRYAVDSNAFENRTSAATATLDSYKKSARTITKITGDGVLGEFTDFGVGDGFIHGDLLYFKDGLTCTLQLTLGNEGPTPLNNVGKALVTRDGVIGVGSETNAGVILTASETLIQHVVKAPLLIRLVDVMATAPLSTNPNAVKLSEWPAAVV